MTMYCTTDARVSEIRPDSLALGGGLFQVDVLGLENPLLDQIQKTSKAVFSFTEKTKISSIEVIGSSSIGPSGETVLSFVAPALPCAQTVEVNVSFNGSNFAPCGHIEYCKPEVKAVKPTRLPLQEATNFRLIGNCFYESDPIE